MGAKTLMRGGAIHSLDFRIRILDFGFKSRSVNYTIGLQYFQSAIQNPKSKIKFIPNPEPAHQILRLSRVYNT